MRFVIQYKPFSLYEGHGTWKNSKFSPHIGSGPLYSPWDLEKFRAPLVQALGLEKYNFRHRLGNRNMFYVQMGELGIFPSPKAYIGEKACSFSKSNRLYRRESSGHPVPLHTSYILLLLFHIFLHISHIFFHIIHIILLISYLFLHGFHIFLHILHIFLQIFHIFKLSSVRSQLRVSFKAPQA